MSFFITNAVARAMLNAFTTANDAGTAAVINIYSGTPPIDADAALSGNTQLAQLTMSATSFGAAADSGSNTARITAAAIASDTSADATGTATFFRILTQNAGTVIGQGTVGTTSADLILNTVGISAGSTVAISTAAIDLPEGP